MRKAYRILVGIPDVKRPFERLFLDVTILLKLILEK
jgi:hypothetical protein